MMFKLVSLGFIIRLWKWRLNSASILSIILFFSISFLSESGVELLFMYLILKLERITKKILCCKIPLVMKI